MGPTRTLSQPQIEPKTVQNPIPVFETNRLILRAPQPQDFEPWVAFQADPEAMRFLGGPQDRFAAWRTMSIMAGAWFSRGHSMFSLVEKATGRWVGRAGPWQPEGWPGTEVGWGLVRDAWGHGYATEAASRILDFVFDDLGWDEVIHCIEPANVGSIAVAKRLGGRMLREAVLPPPIGFHVECWGQTRADWLARRG
jgi:RimJ/RimL family protein N-acetyltransferase